MKDNGSGTDHGSGGGAFIIGDNVKGGLYSEYPSIEPGDWLNGEDMRHTFDFRGVYGTLLEQWLGLDPTAIVGGTYEQLRRSRRPWERKSMAIESPVSQGAATKTFPYALLRAGFPYFTTLGMRRVTTSVHGHRDRRRGPVLRPLPRRRSGRPDPPLQLGRRGPRHDRRRRHRARQADVAGPSSSSTSDENLYVSDEGTHRISIFHRDGDVPRPLGRARHRPGPAQPAVRHRLRRRREHLGRRHPEPPRPEVHQGRPVHLVVRRARQRPRPVRPAVGHRRRPVRRRLRRRLGQRPRPEVHRRRPAPAQHGPLRQRRRRAAAAGRRGGRRARRHLRGRSRQPPRLPVRQDRPLRREVHRRRDASRRAGGPTSWPTRRCCAAAR